MHPWDLVVSLKYPHFHYQNLVQTTPSHPHLAHFQHPAPHPNSIKGIKTENNTSLSAITLPLISFPIFSLICSLNYSSTKLNYSYWFSVITGISFLPISRCCFSSSSIYLYSSTLSFLHIFGFFIEISYNFS